MRQVSLLGHSGVALHVTLVRHLPVELNRKSRYVAGGVMASPACTLRGQSVVPTTVARRPSVRELVQPESGVGPVYEA